MEARKIYEDTPEFEVFSKEAFDMDTEKLKTEIAFKEKCIFFTERAARREHPGGDQTMHNQAERMWSQLKFMQLVLKGKSPKVKKSASKRKKR